MFSLLLLIIVCLLIIYCLFRDLSRPPNFPPGPLGLPVVGSTPLLRKLSRSLGGQHLALSQLAAEYKTSVLGLRLGRELVVVAFTPPVVRQVLIRDEYVGRPDNFFVRLRCFGSKRGITFADGDLWHEQRGFTLRTLRDLGMGKPRMEGLIAQQIQELLAHFHKVGTVRPMEVLSPCIIRVLWEIVSGQRLSADHHQLTQLMHILKIRNRAFDMAGGLLSQFPWIRHIAPGWSGYSLLTDLNEQMRLFLMETVETHKSSYKKDETRDLIDAFLHQAYKCDSQAQTSFTDDQLVMVLVDLFLGGASSTSTTLDFALLLMLCHPDCQEKVYNELTDVLGPLHTPIYADRSRLPYTEAVLLEVQRYCTVIPVTGPRRVLEDTNLNGYFIPKGTTVLLSEWSVHQDPLVFPRPSQFQPERFLQPDRSNLLDNLIPFALGKRRCLGESLAKPCLFLIFTAIMKNFKLELRKGVAVPSAVPVPGIVLTPQPYFAVFTPRIPTS